MPEKINMELDCLELARRLTKKRGWFRLGEGVTWPRTYASAESTGALFVVELLPDGVFAEHYVEDTDATLGKWELPFADIRVVDLLWREWWEVWKTVRSEDGDHKILIGCYADEITARKVQLGSGGSLEKRP